MTNKLVVIINRLKLPKIKKILLYEMNFLVPNYSCLQNPRSGVTPPPDPRSLCRLSSYEFVEPPLTKFLGTPLLPTKKQKVCCDYYKQKSWRGVKVMEERQVREAVKPKGYTLHDWVESWKRKGSAFFIRFYGKPPNDTTIKNRHSSVKGTRDNRKVTESDVSYEIIFGYNKTQGIA